MMQTPLATNQIALNKPHSQKQDMLIRHPGNVVTFAGRRWGKTDANIQRLFYWMSKNHGLYWWVGLSWTSASMKRAWREVRELSIKVLNVMGLKWTVYINNSVNEITIPGLGEIWFRSAANPPALAGEGVMGVILDEFTLMPEIVWTEYVQATLLDYDGWASFAGVPKGINWGSLLWQSAPDKEGWMQIHATTYDNPKINKKLIDNIRNDPNTPEFYFNQEYMAEILSAEGMVFANVLELACLEPLDKPEKDGFYVAGVDVADKMDFTVVTVMDVRKREAVFMSRFQDIGYPALEDKLHAIYEYWNIEVMVIEDNSIGAPVIDHLRERGMAVEAFTTTNSSKQPLIRKLKGAFEHRAIRVLNHPQVVQELLAFEGHRLSGGGFRYSGPAGIHDDIVMSIAFAWRACQRYSYLDEVDNEDDFNFLFDG
jgi:hypothetical protein